jgi:hypothetical protein
MICGHDDFDQRAGIALQSTLQSVATRACFHFTFIALAALADFTPVAADDTAQNTPEQIAFFESRIRPVLVERCLDCHSGDEPESGLNLSSRELMLRGGELGTAVLPGKAAESLLISAIKHDEFVKMPPKEKLSALTVADFIRWVDMGAPWPNPAGNAPNDADERASPGQSFSEQQLKHWAFQPVSDPVPPQVESNWPTSPIDHFVLEKLRAAGLEPAPPADRRTLMRRATFDLTGLPPTVQEVNDFLRDDSPDAFAKVVDRLLTSPRYGERWGRHWLDVARYADSNGLDENISYANAFHYRDYVISALNADKPYARFVQEQIAGDLLTDEGDVEDLDRYIATGFLALGAKMLAEDDPVKMQMDIIDEQISTLGQTFMGLTIGCARCHDHKFDPFPTADYYSLAGIFKSSKTMENHNVVAVWYERPLVTTEVSGKIAEIDRQLAESKAAIDEFKAKQRGAIATRIRNQFAAYLLATAQFDQLQTQRRTDSVIADNSSPFSIAEGFVIFEAEAFQRGDVEKVVAGYGEGIGITGTRGAGFLEYDVRADRAGAYQLEIRHAAAESRPLKLIVNGKAVNESVAANVTGSWNPEGQRWFAAGQFELNAGDNIIRLQSDKVHPHLDRLAIVYSDPGPWPFVDEAPASITRIMSTYNIDAEELAAWSEFLGHGDPDVRSKFPSLEPWRALSGINTATFKADAVALVAEISGDAQSLAVICNELKATPPDSLEDVAKIYQRQLENETVNAELSQLPCPLAGPESLAPSDLPTEERRHLTAIQQQHDDLHADRPSPDVAMGVTESTPEDLKIHLRGSHIALGDLVPRRFPRIISDELCKVPSLKIGDGQSGRLQLAEWLTHQDHPLTWRVIVNRVWHWRFGRGLSPSVDNFGLLGLPPTHPELLDWLAKRFQEDGGSLKKLHRRMMLSSTYQMSTRFDSNADNVDTDNSLLWRFRRRRLTGEELRDSLLTFGNGLDTAMGGSLLKVKNRSYVTASGTSITDEFQNHRRSVYLPVVRSSVYDVLQTFDFPDPAVAAGMRQTSTIAPQALMLLNSTLVDQQTMAMSKRLVNLATDRERVADAFRTILNKEPVEPEFEAAVNYVAGVMSASSLTDVPNAERVAKAWQSYCRVLVSSNEFAYIE